MASENGSEEKAPKRAKATLKMIVSQKVVALKRPLPFPLKVPVNIRSSHIW